MAIEFSTNLEPGMLLSLDGIEPLNWPKYIIDDWQFILLIGQCEDEFLSDYWDVLLCSGEIGRESTSRIYAEHSIVTVNNVVSHRR